MVYTDPAGDLVWFIPVVAGVVGGGFNLWQNRDNINNFGDGLAAFGIGAAAGVAGVYAAPVASVGVTLGATVTSYAAAGAVGGAVGGALQGFGNGTYFGTGSLSDRVFNGVSQAFQGAVIGGITGGIFGGVTGAFTHWLTPKVPTASAVLDDFNVEDQIASNRSGEVTLDTPIEVTTSARSTRNPHLAGKNHLKTNVPYDIHGYPNFKGHLHPSVTNDVIIGPTGRRLADEAAANAAAGLVKTPKGWTWHHHQQFGRMQLVNRTIHTQTGHTGGAKLWKAILAQGG
ncbi:HNH endonuclease [Neolewinella antarctica]|uniref:HNH endonuclease n=1 Tax=Neolewinella antarctica TaxID=442734 RepID=A0ABX0XF12_9BACT|nr:HNH endonuclease [Neolewinella antarctica]NJC27499.1 hypothetical protein [Neolewinella antarctica]